MADIRMSAAVRAVLGPDGVSQAASVTLATGVCVVCEQNLDPEEPANVVVAVGCSVAHVRYSHLACADSAVVEVPAQDLRPTPGDGGVTMRMSAGLVEHRGTVLPVLMAELQTPVFLRDGAGSELVDVLSSGLLQGGFSLIGRLRQAPAPAAQWVAAFGDPCGSEGAAPLHVLEPDGTIFYTGTFVPSAAWVREVERYRWCVLYAGRIGLADVPGQDQRATTRALRTAAAAGRLVGARLSAGQLDVFAP
ncbi:hypothetical protein U9R90_18935 [Streptomyces sp. E11-3]|uniref:hypothetical protein n=1 Tax=Streptomyces sp. E11-3 TaxID=3110112 RepID=UPI0039805660